MTGSRLAVVALCVCALVVGSAVPGSAGSHAPTSAASPSPRALSALADPKAYPRNGIASVKGLQPDFWPNPADNEPGLGTVSVNFVWAE